MIQPHGSATLDPRHVADPARRAALQAEAASLPQLLLSSAAAANAVPAETIKAAPAKVAYWAARRIPMTVKIAFPDPVPTPVGQSLNCHPNRRAD